MFRRLAPTLLVGLLAASVTAQPCVDYRDFLRIVGNTLTGGSARDLAVDGSFGYLANGNEGLAVLDLADPARPVVIAGEGSAGTCLWVAYHAQHVYLANIDSELHVLDVSDPSRPVPVAMLPLPGDGQAVVVRGQQLLVPAGQAGLLVIDVGNPAQPVIVGAVDTPGTARGVAFSGDLAAVADDAGLAVIDLGIPQQPRLVGWVETLDHAYDVALDGPIALVTSWNAGLEVFDLTAPAAPAAVSQLPLPGTARNIKLVGGEAFIACSGLCVVDVALPDRPRLVGRASTTAAPITVLPTGALTYVAAAGGGVDVFDSDPPLSPPSLGRAAVAGVAFGLDTAGDLTFVGGEDLDIFDHSDPAAPVLLGSFPFTGSTSRLRTDGRYVYLTTAGAGGARLLVIDAADPAAPSLATFVPVEGFVSGVCVGDGVVYLGDFFYGGLYTVDVGDPTRARVVDTDVTRPYALQLARAGSHLLVGTGAFGDGAIQVFDIATPQDPSLVAELPVDARGINGLRVQGALAYATLHQGGEGLLAVIDASDPTALAILGTLRLPDELHDVVVDGDVAYVTTFLGFVHVVDVSDPTAPRWLGQTFLPDSAFVLALSDRAVHAAATDAGLVLLPLHCAASVAVEDDDPADGDTPPRPPLDALLAYPNPFNPRVTLAFALPRSGAVALDVFDVAGRRVASPWRGELAAGPHAFTWDGRDLAGRALPSGRYLARLSGEQMVRTATVTLVR
ncbi:MAG: FlgD immunoglobulin-like domain containing protein [Candidatus Krumholzibacteriia bacterium]